MKRPGGTVGAVRPAAAATLAAPPGQRPAPCPPPPQTCGLSTTGGHSPPALAQTIGKPMLSFQGNKETYLSDGLFVSFDGYHIILRAPRSGGDHWVAMEPAVLQAFDSYRQSLFADADHAAKNAEQERLLRDALMITVRLYGGNNHAIGKCHTLTEAMECAEKWVGPGHLMEVGEDRTRFVSRQDPHIGADVMTGGSRGSEGEEIG